VSFNSRGGLRCALIRGKFSVGKDSGGRKENEALGAPRGVAVTSSRRRTADESQRPHNEKPEGEGKPLEGGPSSGNGLEKNGKCKKVTAAYPFLWGHQRKKGTGELIVWHV